MMIEVAWFPPGLRLCLLSFPGRPFLSPWRFGQGGRECVFTFNLLEYCSFSFIIRWISL